MLKRRYEPHEALIIAARDLEKSEYLESGGVTTQHLKRHKLTKGLADHQLYRAASRANAAGLLMSNVKVVGSANYEFWGLWLSDQGIARANQLSRPRWQSFLVGFSRDLRALIVGAGAGAVAGIVVQLIY
jgi:hypothetical protein